MNTLILLAAIGSIHLDKFPCLYIPPVHCVELGEEFGGYQWGGAHGQSVYWKDGQGFTYGDFDWDYMIVGGTRVENSGEYVTEFSSDRYDGAWFYCDKPCYCPPPPEPCDPMPEPSGLVIWACMSLFMLFWRL